jgi:hypothetical protein
MRVEDPCKNTQPPFLTWRPCAKITLRLFITGERESNKLIWVIYVTLMYENNTTDVANNILIEHANLIKIINIIFVRRTYAIITFKHIHL